MNDKLPRWFAVQTRPAAEYIAEVEMRRVGLTVYLPQFRKEYRHHRSKAWLTKQFPLFAGYLFVVADELDWGALSTCNGIERDPILRDPKGKPLPIDGVIIQRVVEKEECGEFDEMRLDTPRLIAGQTVSIHDGAFAGMEGPLSRVKSRKNVQLLISLFNTQVKATTSVGKLTRAA